MKRYEKYKPSGVEWIGDIPVKWNLMKLNYLVNAIADVNHYMPNDVDFGYPYVMTGDLKEYASEIDFDNCKQISETDYKELSIKVKSEKEDVIFARYATIGTVCYVDINKSFVVSYSCVTIKPKQKLLHGKYLFYHLKSQSFYEGISQSINSNTQGNVGIESLSAEKIPVPPLPEQNAIATYLDAKCAKIDNVVAVQQKRIELLKELKQSIITHAVTRGLDKNAKLKDSGVEWIGEMPEEWEVCKIKHNFKIYAGATPKTENKSYWDGDIVWITPADFKTEDKYIIQGERNITIEGYNSCNTQLVPKRSIIFSKRAPIGTVALNEVDLCTNQGCLSCVPKQVNSLFYYYVFSICTEMFDMLGSGATFKEISADIFANVKLPTPPLPEQTAIATYLDKKCAIIDRQIAKVEKQIELLKEYKQSVITECVTGKRKVC